MNLLLHLKYIFYITFILFMRHEKTDKTLTPLYDRKHANDVAVHLCESGEVTFAVIVSSHK